ncbi:MAG: DUF4337 domain-containing protein [Saonia sp.]
MQQNKKSDVTTTTAPLASEAIRSLGAVLIVVFATLTAISGMMKSTSEENRMIAHNKHTSYSDWYQAKSIKQILKENELDYLESMLATGVDAKGSDIIKNKIKDTKALILKYNAEKTELLIGSSQVPKEYWAQDLDGEMGKIVGLREWELLITDYEIAIKKFNLGAIFFQICIVLGAVCLILYSNPKLQKVFVFLMICFGTIGLAISGYGLALSP